MTYPHRPPLPGSPPPVRGGSAPSTVLLVLGFVLVGVCGLVITLTVLLSTGPLAFGVGLAFALLPVAPLVAFFGWLDRYEPEPRGLLVFAFGWGAAVATLGSLVLNVTSIYALDAAQLDGELLGTVAVAPVVEETLKGLGLLAIVGIGRRRFDSLVDGVVYAGVVGVGFAFVENILYLGNALLEGGGPGLIGTFVARGIFSPFAHPLFTAAFGVGLAIALRKRGIARLAAPAGYLLAIALHALWNGSASLGLSGFVAVFVVIHLPLFAGYLALAVWWRTREPRLIRRHLQPYADAGWLGPAELHMLSDLRLRRQAVAGVGRTRGPRAAAALQRFQRHGVELAYLRHRVVTGSAPRDAAVLERGLLERMVGLRATALS